MDIGLLTPTKSPGGSRGIPARGISSSGRSTKTPTRKYASPVGQRKVISRGKNNLTLSNELDQELDFISELTGKKKSKPKEVDIDSCDLETLLTSRPPTADYDHKATICKHYKQKCRQLKVIPVSLFMRQCGASSLNLQNHQLGPRGVHALATALLIDTSLTTIDLSGNDIKDEGVKYLAEALSENHFVTNLRVARNSLTAKGAHYLCLLLEHNGCITHLDISGNHFGDKAMPYLEEMIQDIHILQELNIAENDLGEESGIALGNIIATNETLVSLNLSWNQIRLKGATAIARGIKENVRLHFLDLSYNGLGQEAAQILGHSLQENTVLRVLDITSTRLNDQAVILLAKGLEKNEGLERLILSHNPFTNNGAYGLLESIKKNEQQHLNVIEMQGIPVKEDFLRVLEEIREMNKQLKVRYDVVPVKKSLINPVEVLFTYLRQNGKTPADVLGIAEENPNNLFTRSEFHSTLQAAGVPMSAELIERLAVMLDKEDKGLVHVGFLFRKWVEVRPNEVEEPGHHIDTQSEAPSYVTELQTEADLDDLIPSYQQVETTDTTIVPGTTGAAEVAKTLAIDERDVHQGEDSESVHVSVELSKDGDNSGLEGRDTNHPSNNSVMDIIVEE